MFTFYGRTQPLARYPVDAALAIVKRLGFDGVEICLENPDLAPANLTHERVQQLGTCCDALGLARSMSYHMDYIYDDTILADTRKAIALAPACGARVFIISGTRDPGRADAWPRMVERTRELVQAAEAAGVTLALEFEPDFIVGSTAALHRLFDAIPSPHLQANLDLGHVFLCDPDPMQAIAGLAGRIAHGHIENMAHGVHCHLPPWTGDMDLRAYLQALAAIDFHGPLALDLYNEDYEAIGTRALTCLRAMGSDKSDHPSDLSHSSDSSDK